jgi:peptidoglycan/xylan/chitin deacetylase (PgdA/CDA1 family)
MTASSPARRAPAFRWPEGKAAAVSLTFDDARTSQVDRGLPVLNAHGVKGTFYVSPPNLAARLDGWRAAAAGGHEIGNHTLTHPCSGNFPFARRGALEDYTLERMERELVEANDVIRDALGVTAATFAYPCGQTFVGRGENARSYVPLVARHFVVGRAAFNEIANDPGFCDLAQATGMEADCRDFAALKALVEGCVSAGGWLILFGHEVGEGGRQTIMADALDALCRYATARPDLWIDTVAAVGRYIATSRNT